MRTSRFPPAALSGRKLEPTVGSPGLRSLSPRPSTEAPGTDRRRFGRLRLRSRKVLEAGASLDRAGIDGGCGVLSACQDLVVLAASVEPGFELDGWCVVEVAVEALVVVPLHPSQRGQLDRLDGLPRP